LASPSVAVLGSGLDERPLQVCENPNQQCQSDEDGQRDFCELVEVVHANSLIGSTPDTTVSATCYVRYMTNSANAEWQLVSITTGSDASLRVYVWRQLRRLGALYLHKSVCLLPNRPEVRTALQPILLRVQAQGGTARNMTITVEGSDHDALVAEQRNDRDEEYREVVERVPAFFSEITMETARGRTTYAEVVESEADLERFEKWLAAITARDYFHAAAGSTARAAVQQCRDALAGFEAAALAAEFDEGETESRRNSAGGLTVVEDAP
jgi:hypothetical protein